ncbi:MAG: C4-type zinc ribbon domain-containing protein [Clostridia bacterium]|nr:C4-type zinc ribbon domain-containing protein [Clostridia bacterium]
MNELNTLLEYHQAHQALAALQSDVKNTEMRKRFNQLHGFLKQQEERITTLTEQLAQTSAKLMDMEDRVEELSRQYALEISDFEMMEKDEECTSEEATYARQSMEKLLSRVKGLSKEMMDTLSFIEAAGRELNSAKTKGRNAMKEYTAVKAACEAEFEDVRPRSEAMQGAIAALEQKLPRELVRRYQAVRRKFPNPMVTIDNSQCGGCNMALPSTVVRRVVQGNELVLCENCGRILYSLQEQQLN